MNLPWFRAYADMVDNEKVRLLSFDDRWHFVAILCCKAQGILDRHGQMTRRKVAVKLGVDLQTLDEIVRRLSEVGLIDAKNFEPTGWKKRQFVSDNSTKRVRKHRKTKGTGNVSETFQKQDSAVTVTPPDTDSDTDSEEEKTSKNLEACVPPTHKKRATRLPEDWAPTPDQIAWARSERKDINPATEASKFRDYWIAKAGRDASKLDWDATWRNWVRNAKAGAKATANGSEPEWLKGAR